MALAVQLQLGSGDLLLVLRYRPPEHAEDLLCSRGEPLVYQKSQHLYFRHFSGRLVGSVKDKTREIYSVPTEFGGLFTERRLSDLLPCCVRMRRRVK